MRNHLMSVLCEMKIIWGFTLLWCSTSFVWRCLNLHLFIQLKYITGTAAPAVVLFHQSGDICFD